MKTLTFYPRRPDGAATAFSVADIEGPEAEALFVRQMFDTHDSATSVEVFEDQILLRRYDRAATGTSKPLAVSRSAPRKALAP